MTALKTSYHQTHFQGFYSRYSLISVIRVKNSPHLLWKLGRFCDCLRTGVKPPRYKYEALWTSPIYRAWAS